MAHHRPEVVLHQPLLDQRALRESAPDFFWQVRHLSRLMTRERVAAAEFGHWSILFNRISGDRTDRARNRRGSSVDQRRQSLRPGAVVGLPPVAPGSHRNHHAGHPIRISLSRARSAAPFKMCGVPNVVLTQIGDPFSRSHLKTTIVWRRPSTGCGRVSHLKRGSLKAATTASESSVQPSPTTRTSKSVNVCNFTDVKAQRSAALQLNAAMMTLIVGRTELSTTIGDLVETHRQVCLVATAICQQKVAGGSEMAKPCLHRMCYVLARVGFSEITR